MQLLFKSMKATTLCIVALSVVYILLFLPRTVFALQQVLASLVGALMYLVVPIFIVMVVLQFMARKPLTPGVGTPRNRGFSTAAVTLIYAAVAGALVLLLPGLILQTWLIFVAAGAVLGFFVGRSNNRRKTA